MLADADEATFKRFLELYRAADLHEEKDRISRALGAVKNVQLLENVLNFAISVSKCNDISQFRTIPRQKQILDQSIST